MRRVVLVVVATVALWVPFGVAHAAETPTQTGSPTAQCVDGMFSDSQNRYGTCASHSGVAHFLGALATPAQGGPCPVAGCKLVGSGAPDPNYATSSTALPGAPGSAALTQPTISTALPSSLPPTTLYP